MLRKRSYTIQGHRTSVALEPAFWAAFDRAAAEEGLSPTAYLTRIDEERTTPLASAIRVALLLRSKNDALPAADGDGGAASPSGDVSPG